jgi:hypothetical protein
VKPRLMTARYRGKCRACGKAIAPGDEIRYFGSKHSEHAACYVTPTPTPSDSPKPIATDPAGEIPDADRFVIDWPDLREIVAATFRDDFSAFRVSPGTARGVMGDFGSFKGYTREQAIDWLANGYTDEALQGLQDFTPPIREKRRFVYGEEGDEIDLSSAWAGEDNFMTHWTKRDVIPGISLEFFIACAGVTSSAVVNEYERWIARATEAIQSAGIDPEISIVFGGKSDWDGIHREEKVIVKRENEIADITSWSAMLSPACYRTYGFLAKILHGEARNKRVSSSIGKGTNYTEWRCYFDPERGVIRSIIPWVPHSFPEEEMTRQLREAIEKLKSGIID